MHAASPAELPHIGERYSSDDLFDRYPGFWALLAFPDGLTPDQEWNIMATPGVLVALETSRSALWMKRRAYRQEHPDAVVYHFATESVEDLALVGSIRGG
jgi:hypothetical protein